MVHKRDTLCFQSSLMVKLDGVIHGFSSRHAGDMRQDTENRQSFLRALGVNDFAIFAQQVHDNRISVVNKQSTGIVPGVDGLISRDVPVAVLAADCVPVLLVDPVNHICAAVHAGWKGTLGNVVGHAVRAMVQAGGEVGKIYGVIGPHIGACCYTVGVERVNAFTQRLGNDEKMAYCADSTWHLDIGLINYRQLIEEGVARDHIDAPPLCTSCQHNDFFSYRKDSEASFGEMVAVVGFRNNL